MLEPEKILTRFPSDVLTQVLNVQVLILYAITNLYLNHTTKENALEGTW